MTWEEIREAIPPAYTEFVGRQLLAALAPGPEPRRVSGVYLYTRPHQSGRPA